jgi:hypothetical protein
LTGSLGKVLVALGMTFPVESCCSLALVLRCWRQIAQAMEVLL